MVDGGGGGDGGGGAGGGAPALLTPGFDMQKGQKKGQGFPHLRQTKMPRCQLLLMLRCSE